jgi:hypothetical protein
MKRDGQVPMPALTTADSLSRNDGDVWVDNAVTRADSFPLTDADTSARYCDTLQHGVSDPPAFTGLQRHAIQLSNTPNHSFGSVLADIPSASGTHLSVCMFSQSHPRVNAPGRMD